MEVIEQYEKWRLDLENQNIKAPPFNACHIVCLKEPQLMETGRIDSAALGKELNPKSVTYLVPDKKLGVASTGFLRTISSTHPDVVASIEFVPQKALQQRAQRLVDQDKTLGIVG